jgi:hypothetical protein
MQEKKLKAVISEAELWKKLAVFSTIPQIDKKILDCII